MKKCHKLVNYPHNCSDSSSREEIGTPVVNGERAGARVRNYGHYAKDFPDHYFYNGHVSEANLTIIEIMVRKILGVMTIIAR